MSLQYGELTVH